MVTYRNIQSVSRQFEIYIPSVLLSLFLLGVPTTASPASPYLVPIGVAKLDITPETPVRMYGYASRKNESEGIAGRLKTTALVIGHDEAPGPAVMLAVDCGSIPEEMIAQLLTRLESKAKISRQRFVVCHSHCHSGPNLKGMKSMSGEQKEHLERYAVLLLDRMEQVVLQALANRFPGCLDWTQGTVAVAANRRVLTDGKWTGFGAIPDAAVDHSLPLLRVTDKHGALRAVVINYACHNTILRNKFLKIHGDWTGSAQSFIEAEHPGALCLITIGCGADSDPYPHGTTELCDRHGRAIADEATRLLRGPFKPIEPRLRTQVKTITLPVQPLPSLEELKKRNNKSWLLSEAIKRLENGETLPTSVDYRVTSWCFGDDLAMVFLEDEVVVDYALRLQRDYAGDRLWVTAYTNKISNYIVSKRLIREGGYEVRNSLSTQLSYGQAHTVYPAVEDLIVKAIGEILPAAFH